MVNIDFIFDNYKKLYYNERLELRINSNLESYFTFDTDFLNFNTPLYINKWDDINYIDESNKLLVRFGIIEIEYFCFLKSKDSSLNENIQFSDIDAIFKRWKLINNQWTLINELYTVDIKNIKKNFISFKKNLNIIKLNRFRKLHKLK